MVELPQNVEKNGKIRECFSAKKIKTCSTKNALKYVVWLALKLSRR